jgi:hypothetical protein
MDGESFDSLIRSWGTDTRRNILKGVAAALIAPLLGSAAGSAQAACKAPGGRCRQSDECCSGRCNRRTGKCRNCPSGQKFCRADSACIAETACCPQRCPNGLTCCTNVGECVDVRNDVNFCGGCTFRCQGADVCANGDCAAPCTGNGNCASDSACAARVDAAHDGQRVCAELGVFTCDNVQTCANDNACGFRRICVSGLCAGKDVCADPRD